MKIILVLILISCKKGKDGANKVKNNIKSYIKKVAKKISIQLLLLILIILAMVQFISVSFIVYNGLKEVSANKETINLLLSKLIGINISMVILFFCIVLLVTKIFRRINYYAFHNCTTGLPNKNYVLNSMINEISEIKEFSAILSLDMDNFKAVNDALGHLAGDELLRQAGERFKQVINTQDCVCHIGGDEFLFLIKSAKDKNQVEIIAKEIVNIFSETFIIDGEKVDYVTASVGIALIPENGRDFRALYNYADDAMYSAKKNGKNSYKFYNENMSLHLYEESIKKKRINEGIKKKEFKVFYQAKMSKEGVLIGAEALVRWIRSDGMILPPSEFIDFAEKNGLIVAISESVIDEVCEQILLWIKKGHSNFTVSINITAQHLANEKLCKSIIEKIKSFNVSPQYLEFEITESMVIKDFDIAVHNIQLIKDFGIKISMDDFGTGYSSLNYLKKLPIDIIKIDKSFIDTITEEEKDKILLENIINIAHSFNLVVVAEGVENERQYEILKKMKCDIFQGYYFGKPVDKDTFEKLFLAGSLNYKGSSAM